MQKSLITFQEAADILGVPKTGLLREAEKHGFVIRLGSSKRICPDEIPELLEKCRDRPKAHDSFCENAKDENLSSSSVTRGSSKARAQKTANKLKSNLVTTSPAKTAEVVRLKRGT